MDLNETETPAGATRIVGLPGSGAWALLARSLLSGESVPGFSFPAFDGPLVIVRSEQEALEDIADACGALKPVLGGEIPIAFFGEDSQARTSALEKIRAGARLILALPEALAGPWPSKEEFKDLTLNFRVGKSFPRAQALEGFARAGYRRVDFVESPGEYAARGAVLDFYSFEPMRAVRVFYSEETVESLRRFNPSTQETEDYLDSAAAVPVAGPGPLEEGAGAGGMEDWLGSGSVWIVEEGVAFTAPEGVRVYGAGRLLEKSEEDLDFGARPNSPCRGRHQIAWDEMASRSQEGRKVILFCLNRGEAERVGELLMGRFSEGSVGFLIGPLRRGFLHKGLSLAVFSTSEIFERNYRPSRWKYFKGSASFRWGELKTGDYVVHVDYGVARYKGLKPIESPGHGVTDCLLLGFRGSDVLYVPMTEFGKIQKYAGGEGRRPRLSSLDTRRWDEVKRMVKEGVRELAQSLIKVSAERKALPGHAFQEEGTIELEFAAEFPFEETRDQAQAIADVLEEMRSPHPMDRLVVGDVGFGKTEVAMRAALKCVTGAKQAALLVPTTILADQHYRNFTRRFADYPVRVGLVTRFQGDAEVKQILKDLAGGGLDVLIGTSRLLQKDVRFKDLGLVVVDEEHRFGVGDKEKLKLLRRSVDCLALSATPIPRSLHQAFSGLRSLSMIQSAPVGRQPIVTRVLPWEEGRVAAAISEELARGGQAFYVHNRVRSLPDCVKRLEALLPQARFAHAHGRMKGAELEKTMWDFFNRKYDVLVASTIIESGLDIPTVNTLLVENAHEFGLAQLYQLRGRIGRERQKAQCLLFTPPDDDWGVLPEDARRRLEALREFGDLGSGFKLAMRDLEIRGAGDILGSKQHGFLNAVGADYYAQLLNEEIENLKGRRAQLEGPAVHLDIKLPAFIPEDYLPGEMERLEFYKRILRSKPLEVPRLKRELSELCGPLPAPVANLFDLLRIRNLASKAGLRSVVQKGDRMEALFAEDFAALPAQFDRWQAFYKERLGFIRSAGGDGVQVVLQGEAPLAWIEGFLASIQ